MITAAGGWWLVVAPCYNAAAVTLSDTSTSTSTITGHCSVSAANSDPAQIVRRLVTGKMCTETECQSDNQTVGADC